MPPSEDQCIPRLETTDPSGTHDNASILKIRDAVCSFASQLKQQGTQCYLAQIEVQFGNVDGNTNKESETDNSGAFTRNDKVYNLVQDKPFKGYKK